MADATGNKIAYIELEKGGTIKAQLYPEVAPNTVANFEKLANSGFYNNLNFHRVVPDFVVQGGDPNGDGTGGPGYKIKAEFNNKRHNPGTLSMARSQHPDSAGSQFYICLSRQPHLDNNYTVFGDVLEGFDLVQKIVIGDRMKSVRVVSE
jgi:peptidyl-prolyl cis-trans isomerase B (cyclophilin B)